MFAVVIITPRFCIRRTQSSKGFIVDAEAPLRHQLRPALCRHSGYPPACHDSSDCPRRAHTSSLSPLNPDTRPHSTDQKNGGQSLHKCHIKCRIHLQACCRHPPLAPWPADRHRFFGGYSKLVLYSAIRRISLIRGTTASSPSACATRSRKLRPLAAPSCSVYLASTLVSRRWPSSPPA